MKKFFYRIQQGQTVLSVSQKFSIPVCVLINDNALKEEIAEGDLLIIKRYQGEGYRVSPSDTLQSVCKKFGVSEQELLNKNGVPYIFYGLNLII